MPRPLVNEEPMTGAERQARYRAVHAAGAPVVRTRRPVDRRPGSNGGTTPSPGRRAAGRVYQLAGVGGGKNPHVNGDESVLKTGQSLRGAALGSVGPGRCETSRRS